MTSSAWFFLTLILAILVDAAIHLFTPKRKPEEDEEALQAAYSTIEDLKAQRVRLEHQLHSLTRQVAFLQTGDRRNRTKLAEAEAILDMNKARESKQRQEAHLNKVRHSPAGTPGRSSDVLRSTDDSHHTNVVPLWDSPQTTVHNTDHGSHHNHDSSASQDSCSSYDTSSPSSDSGSGGGGGCD